MKRTLSPLPWALLVLILTIIGISWVMNLKRLSACDFNAPYRCEVIHGLGIVPMFSVVTVWFDSDA